MSTATNERQTLFFRAMAQCDGYTNVFIEGIPDVAVEVQENVYHFIGEGKSELTDCGDAQLLLPMLACFSRQDGRPVCGVCISPKRIIGYKLTTKEGQPILLCFPALNGEVLHSFSMLIPLVVDTVYKAVHQV